MEIKKFWYESNACWGYVESFSELAEKAKLQINDNYNIKNIDDFLEKSKYSIGFNSFGTRGEHNSNHTLKQYLIDNNQLNEFLEFYKTN